MRILAKFDIQKIQYMNTFEQITGVKAKACFFYSNTVIFTVPKIFLNKALGKNAVNVERLMSKLNRKVRVIAIPRSKIDLENFINSVIYPYKITRISFENESAVIHANQKIKALLIGKGESRLRELNEILEQFFNIRKVIIK